MVNINDPGFDKEGFLKALSAEWIVVKTEIEGDTVKIVHRSKTDPWFEWIVNREKDHPVPSVGTICKIAFVWESQ